MSAKFIRRIVDLFIAIVILGALLKIGRAVAAMLDGGFGTLHWPVQASSFELKAPVGEGVWTTFGDGTLAVPGQPFWHGIDLLFSLAAIGILVAALLLLRSLLIRFANGELMTGGNAHALRKIGWMLLTMCGLSVLHAVVMQTAILSAVTAQPGIALHPSLSWDVQGMKNIWLHYDVPVFTFVLGGLALLFSEAFRAGTAYREDSESVV